MPAVNSPRTLATLLLVITATALALVAWLVLRDPARSVAAPELAPGAGNGSAAAEPSLPGAVLERPRAAEERSLATGAEPDVRASRERSATDGEPAPAVEFALEGPFLLGSVVDASGVPIADAEVTVKARDPLGGGGLTLGKKPFLSETVRTNASGVYRVPRGGHGDAEVTIDVSARGFRPRTEVRFPDSREGDGRLGATVVEHGVVLGGVVVDANGEPVAGASVLRTTRAQEGLIDGIFGLAASMEGGGPEKAETDERGRFELAHEAAGEYVLLFEHPAYPRGRLEGATPPPGSQDLAIELRFVPAVTLSGRIVGFPEGKKHVMVQATPQQQAEEENTAPVVSFFDEISGGSGPTTKVASDGTFLFEGLVGGTRYGVQAFISFGVFERIAASDVRTVEGGAAGVELVWDAGTELRFDVLDAETGELVSSEVDVRHVWQRREKNVAMPSAVKRATFPRGKVVVEELRPSPSPGLLDLAVSAEGYLTHRETGVVIEADRGAELAAVRLRRAPMLRVRVLEAGTDEPVRRARVSLHPLIEEELARAQENEDVLFAQGLVNEVQTVKTDRDGWCELPVCSSRTARLSVRRSGYVDHDVHDFAVPTEDGREEIVWLSTGGELEVEVLDSQDRPVAEAQVIERGGGRRETNSRGVALFKDLAPGDHAFRALRQRAGGVRVNVSADDEDGPADEDWERVSIASGDRARLVLRVPATASIGGRVTAGGAPMAGVPVLFLPGAEETESDQILTRMSEGFASMMPGSMARTRTDQDGYYRLADVTVGDHRLHVVPSTGAPAHVEAISVGEGENDVDVELPGGTVEGRVVDAAGEPIAGARVRVGRAEEESELSGEVGLALSIFGSAPDGVVTDYDGSFVVPGLPGGIALRAGVEADGFVPDASDEFTVPEGGRVEGIEVVLGRGGSLLVKLVGDGGPFAMLSATFQGESDPPAVPRHAVGRRGEARFEGLNAGIWRIELSGSESGGQLVEIHAGQASEIALER